MEFISGMQSWFNIKKSMNIIPSINCKERKKYMIIPIDEEKEFDNIQYMFMIKLLSSLGIEGNFLNLIAYITKKKYS